MIETSKEILQQCREELDRIRDNLQIKGDHFRAKKVEAFKKRFFQ